MTTNDGDVNNSSWDFWDKVYSNKELRQKMEEKSQNEVSMSELLKSANLCRAELTILNVPRMAPAHESTLRQFIKEDLKIDVPIINMDIAPKKWILRFYRREDASQVLKTLSGYVYKSRVLHATLHEVHTQVEVTSALTVDEIMPAGIPAPNDRNTNWGIVEWDQLQDFRTTLCALIRRNANGITIEDAIGELRPTLTGGLIALAMDNFPIGLVRMYVPQVRMTGRYLSLSDQDNIASLVRLSLLEKSPRFPLEEWEPFPPSEIRADHQLMEYFFRLLSHFGPQHVNMSMPLRLAVSTIAPSYPRGTVELAERLIKLSHTFIIIEDTLYLTTSVRHRRLLYESIAPPAQPPRINRIVIKD